VSPAKKIRRVRSAAPIATAGDDITADSDRWFRAVADNTSDWESWYGPDGRLLWVNPAVERMTGYSVADCLAMPGFPLPLVVDEDGMKLSEALSKARSHASTESVDFRIRSRDGELRWMSVSWQPMHGPTGQYLGYRTSIRDVTERHLLREQLRLHAEHLEQLVQERTERLYRLEQRQRQMERMAALGQLAAGVAHEINNPLAGIRNAFELIKGSLPAEHEHYELLALIDKEIERISGITHQMYQLYKRAPSQPTRFAIDQVVREVLYMLNGPAEKQRVRLGFETPAEPLWVTLIEGEVKQILYNLVRNAIQASPAESTVTIRISSDEREIGVHVDDQGSGIPGDILPRIFDPFFTTKQSHAQSGMGLGLSVSRNLIESVGGRITVKSELHQGSLFSAYFPRLSTTTEASDV
jgi:two-component system sporulation sensor kinase C